MPESGGNGKDLGGGIRRRKQEVSSQIVQIEGGSQILELVEKLGSMGKVVEKLTAAVDKLDPKTIRGQRSLPALCRSLADIFFKCQAVNLKLAREQQVEEMPMNLLGLEDEDVLAIASDIKNRRAARAAAIEDEETDA